MNIARADAFGGTFIKYTHAIANRVCGGDMYKGRMCNSRVTPDDTAVQAAAGCFLLL